MAASASSSGADAIVVGAGLAGLVATAELVAAGRRVILVDQEPLASLGGQAFWSFGGLFLINSPEQRRLGIHDSPELAEQDWMGAAGFDRGVDDPAGADYWARRWALAYLDFAKAEKRAWLHALGVRFFPVVGWAERGGQLAGGQGNSVPRFHITWGTGPALVAPFIRRVLAGAEQGQVRLALRHRVDELVMSDGAAAGIRGAVLEPSYAPRGAASSRSVVGSFEWLAPAVIISSGGIGGNHELIRASWPARLGRPPRRMLTGVPAHVDGRMLAICQRAGARLVNCDRMWHYPEGVRNWSPIWPGHGIRILPGPSSIWLDALGRRLPAPNFPGFDSLGALQAILATGHDHSWFVLNRKIVEREFALSGSEQNPDLTGKSLRQVLRRSRSGVPPSIQAFLDHGEDFIVATDLDELVRRMNQLQGEPRLDPRELGDQIVQRDREMGNRFSKDLQVMAIHNARRYLGDRLTRVAKPHHLLDPAARPLIAVRLRILSRKTLGGLQTDLSGRVLLDDGAPLPGLFAAGEAAGFGGGGIHGYRSLEGTFLGGCLFSGRVAGREVARALSDRIRI